MTALELFTCQPYACRLTRAACAQRHESALHGDARSAVASGAGLRWSKCRTCEVGAAHARGERPDVDVAALVRREEVEVATMYTHGGQTLTAGQWAQRPEVAALGLSAQAIRSRIEIGWTVADALSTPKGAPRPGTSAPKKISAPKDEEPRKRPVQRAPRKAAPDVRAQVEETIETHVRRAKARRASESAASTVRETLTALSPADLLTRLGYVVEDAGLVPAGHLLIVRVPA